MANDALGDRTADVTLPSGYTIHRDKAGVVRVDPDGVYSTIDGSRLGWSSVVSISTVSRRHGASVGAAWGGVLGFGATFLTTFTILQNQRCGSAPVSLCHDGLINGIGAASLGALGALAGALVGLAAGSMAGEGTVVDRQRP